MTRRGTEGTRIHPTAVVHPTAQLDDGVDVGAYAVIGARVVVGSGTVIGPHSVLHHDVVLGQQNELAAHVVIGGRPQDLAYRGEQTTVVVGDRNIFSEFSSVDRATGEGNATRIGNGVFIMSCTRVSHNCRIGDGAILVSGTQLGGWVDIGDHAYLGGLSGVHQFVHIGRLAIIAGHSGVRQDVPPYLMVGGFMARAIGLNVVGLKRHQVPPEDRLALRRAFRIFYQSHLPMEAALSALELEAAKSAPVRDMLEFINAARGRKRGIIRWRAETPPLD